MAECHECYFTFKVLKYSYVLVTCLWFTTIQILEHNPFLKRVVNPTQDLLYGCM